MVKKALWLILGILLFVLILFVASSKLSPVIAEHKIDKFVLNNQEELEQVAHAYLQGDFDQKEYKKVKIDGLFEGEHQIVQFFHSGVGIAPSSKYYGFYYSEDNVPVSFQNGREPVKEVAENEWTWKGSGDNGGRTKKIVERWYYYEAWF